jgi:hypothetical protein
VKARNHGLYAGAELNCPTNEGTSFNDNDFKKIKMTENKKTISMAKATILGSLLGVLLVGILALPFYLVYGIESFEKLTLFFKFRIFVPSVVLGIIVHEFIHGLTWSIAAKIPVTNIKYGFQLKTLTPFAHCKVPINIIAYRIGTLMPFILMGLAPYLYSILTENQIVLGFSLFFSFSAIGDLIILWITRNISADKDVQDHPTEGGVIVVD